MSESILDLSKELAGRRALVTGGFGGISAAIAQPLGITSKGKGIFAPISKFAAPENRFMRD